MTNSQTLGTIEATNPVLAVAPFEGGNRNVTGN